MSLISFRATQPPDSPQIFQLFTCRAEMQLIYPSGNFPMTIEQLEEIARVRVDLTSVVDGDRIVGFSNLSQFIPEKLAFMGNVVIHPQHRGRGFRK
ncbi:MAG: hypothetical protein AB4040_19025 [Synechococcus sp.]